MASTLPAFEEARARAYALLGDAADELRSDWAPGGGPTPEQHRAVRVALELIGQAKEALNRAAP